MWHFVKQRMTNVECFALKKVYISHLFPQHSTVLLINEHFYFILLRNTPNEFKCG